MTSERIFIIGRASWELFAGTFQRALQPYWLTPEIVICGFDRELRLWSGQDEDFAMNPPRGAIVFPEARDLFQRHFTASHSEMSPEDAGTRAAEFLLRAVSSLSERHPEVAWVL